MKTLKITKRQVLLIAESFNVANETGLTPRELLNQRNELLEATKALVEYCKYHKISLGSGIIYQIETAIANTTKQNQ